MLIWKSPAAIICILGFIPFLALTTLLDAETASWHFALTGGLIFGIDLYYRKRMAEVELFDLETSTLFFVIPTWAFGLLVVAFGAATGV